MDSPKQTVNISTKFYFNECYWWWGFSRVW